MSRGSLHRVGILLCCIVCNTALGQVELGKLEISDYVANSKLKCKDYMLVIETQVESEPGLPSSHRGTEEFVELISYSDGIHWQRAVRNMEKYVTSNQTYDFQKSGSWSRLETKSKLYGVDHGSLDQDLYRFDLLQKHDPGFIAFPSLFDLPFWLPARMTKNDISNIAEKVLVNRCICQQSTEKDSSYTSLWKHKNPSNYAWEVVTKAGYVTRTKLLRFPNIISEKVPDIESGKIMNQVDVTWREDDCGKYPMKVRATMIKDEAAVLVEANISIDVDTKFRKELGLIKKRLAQLD